MHGVVFASEIPDLENPWRLDSVEWHHHYQSSELIASSLHLSSGFLNTTKAWVYLHRPDRRCQVSIQPVFSRQGRGFSVNGDALVVALGPPAASLSFRVMRIDGDGRTFPGRDDQSPVVTVTMRIRVSDGLLWDVARVQAFWDDVGQKAPD